MAERGENKPQKVTPIVIEGFEINAQNVTYQKLQEFSLILYEKLLIQRRDRNFLLLDRDKFRTILENTRHEIQVAKHINCNKDEELERAQERYRQEMKEIDQEVKYVLYDHSIHLSELNSWESNILAKTEQQHLSEELELLQEKRRLKEELAEQENRHEVELKILKNQHLEEIANLKNKCDAVQIEKEMEFKRSLNTSVEQLTLKHEMEMSEIEERKNTHLAQLKQIHKTRLDEMKTFFNSTTAENLAVISSLKQNLDGMKKNKTIMTAEVKQLKQENKKLRDPLIKSKSDVKNLTRQLFNYEKDLLCLKNNKRILKNTLEDIKKLRKQSNLALRKIKCSDNKEPSDLMESTCLQSLVQFKTDATHKRRELQELACMLIGDLKKKQEIIKDLTSDPDVLQALKELHFEFWNPRNVCHELAVICKAYDELLETLKKKLEEFCVPEQKLGFKPLGVQYIGSNPAALVSKQ